MEALLVALVLLAITGLVIGAIGRLLVPGPSPLGLVGTMGAGIAGAFIGGIVGRLLFGAALTPGWLLVLSILGAALVVAVFSGYGRRTYAPRTRRGPMSPAAYDDRVVVDDVRDPYPPVRRRRRWFG